MNRSEGEGNENADAAQVNSKPVIYHDNGKAQSTDTDRSDGANETTSKPAAAGQSMDNGSAGFNSLLSPQRALVETHNKVSTEEANGFDRTAAPQSAANAHSKAADPSAAPVISRTDSKSDYGSPAESRAGRANDHREGSGGGGYYSGGSVPSPAGSHVSNQSQQQQQQQQLYQNQTLRASFDSDVREEDRLKKERDRQEIEREKAMLLAMSVELSGLNIPGVKTGPVPSKGAATNRDNTHNQDRANVGRSGSDADLLELDVGSPYSAGSNLMGGVGGGAAGGGAPRPNKHSALNASSVTDYGSPYSGYSAGSGGHPSHPRKVTELIHVLRARHYAMPDELGGSSSSRNSYNNIAAAASGSSDAGSPANPNRSSGRFGRNASGFSNEDEWENDEDNGYIVLTLSEEEFFEFEEENTARIIEERRLAAIQQQLSAVSASAASATTTGGSSSKKTNTDGIASTDSAGIASSGRAAANTKSKRSYTGEEDDDNNDNDDDDDDQSVEDTPSPTVVSVAPSGMTGVSLAVEGESEIYCDTDYDSRSIGDGPLGSASATAAATAVLENSDSGIIVNKNSSSSSSSSSTGKKVGGDDNSSESSIASANPGNDTSGQPSPLDEPTEIAADATNGIKNITNATDAPAVGGDKPLDGAKDVSAIHNAGGAAVGAAEAVTTGGASSPSLSAESLRELQNEIGASTNGGGGGVAVGGTNTTHDLTVKTDTRNSSLLSSIFASKEPQIPNPPFKMPSTPCSTAATDGGTVAGGVSGGIIAADDDTPSSESHTPVARDTAASASACTAVANDTNASNVDPAAVKESTSTAASAAVDDSNSNAGQRKDTQEAERNAASALLLASGEFASPSSSNVDLTRAAAASGSAVSGTSEDLFHSGSRSQPNSSSDFKHAPEGSNTAGRRQSVGERRRTEIMGQRKFMGVDGMHCYFNLKIIFEPFRTGFEENKDLQHPKGTIIAGRYEVADVLGTAAFSTALQCVDLAAEDDEAQWVCLKVIKNNKDFFDQSLDEIKLLQYINSHGDPDEHNVLRLIDFFYCKEHLFIVSELLKENLYEFGRFIKESGNAAYYTMPRLKRIMKQVLEALVYIHSLKLIHCDIKPENIVIKSFSRCEVKLIDFGSSCFTSDHLTTYIQSRSYRAPEVILGLSYDSRIDIWSVGAVLAELHTGYVLFQNDSVATMLARIVGIMGQFPAHVLQKGRDTGKYFSMSNIVYERDEEGSFQLVFPKKTNINSRLHMPPKKRRRQGLTLQDKLFVDFVRQMLNLDHHKRMTAEEALQHPWMADADSVYVSEYIIGQRPDDASSDDGDDDDDDDDEYDMEDQHDDYGDYEDPSVVTGSTGFTGNTGFTGFTGNTHLTGHTSAAQAEESSNMYPPPPPPDDDEDDDEGNNVNSGSTGDKRAQARGVAAPNAAATTTAATAEASTAGGRFYRGLSSLSTAVVVGMESGSLDDDIDEDDSFVNGVMAAASNLDKQSDTSRRSSEQQDIPAAVHSSRAAAAVGGDTSDSVTATGDDQTNFSYLEEGSLATRSASPGHMGGSRGDSLLEKLDNDGNGGANRDRNHSFSQSGEYLIQMAQAAAQAVGTDDEEEEEDDDEDDDDDGDKEMEVQEKLK